MAPMSTQLTARNSLNLGFMTVITKDDKTYTESNFSARVQRVICMYYGESARFAADRAWADSRIRNLCAEWPVNV